MIENIDELAVAAREGLVEITYTKKDGSITTRQATLNNEKIKSFGYVFKESSNRRPSPSQFIYYEIDSKQFKSCLKDNIVVRTPDSF